MAGPPGDPQKTNAEGPDFDFDHPEAIARADALRIAAMEIGSICARHPAGGGVAYAALSAELETAMPAFYRAYDAYVTAVIRTGSREPACGRGCAHCCRHYVESVEPFELVFFHGRLSRRPDYPSLLVALHRRVSLFQSLLKRRDGDLAEDKALYRYYLRGMPCPFLKPDGACGAYSMRPMSCRMFFSLSSPEFCKGRAVVDPRNRNFLIELPEDIEAILARAGRALGEYALPESLFGGLLRANEAFARFETAPG